MGIETGGAVLEAVGIGSCGYRKLRVPEVVGIGNCGGRKLRVSETTSAGSCVYRKLWVLKLRVSKVMGAGSCAYQKLWASDATSVGSCEHRGLWILETTGVGNRGLRRTKALPAQLCQGRESLVSFGMIMNIRKPFSVLICMVPFKASTRSRILDKPIPLFSNSVVLEA